MIALINPIGPMSDLQCFPTERRHNLVTHPNIVQTGKRQRIFNAPFNQSQQKLQDKYYVVRTKKVSFSTVQVRQYGICLGDSPSCRSGPPISLSWARTKVRLYSLDEYESTRRRRRRSKLIMSPQYREKLLLFIGYTAKQIKETCDEIEAINKASR